MDGLTLAVLVEHEPNAMVSISMHHRTVGHTFMHAKCLPKYYDGRQLEFAEWMRLVGTDPSTVLPPCMWCGA